MLPPFALAAIDWRREMGEKNCGLFVRRITPRAAAVRNLPAHAAPKPITPTITAVHEAGHIAAAYIFGIGVDFATITPSTDLAGSVLFNRDDLSRATPLDKATVCAAGAAAESKFTGRQCEMSQSDARAFEVAARNVPRRDYFDFCDRARRRAEKTIGVCWDFTIPLARELTTRGEMTGEEINEFFDMTFCKPPHARKPAGLPGHG